MTRLFYILFLVLSLLPTLPASASADSKSSDSSYNFLFGNHIDTHQATQLKSYNGSSKALYGYFYIFFTGEIDPVSQLPIARHPRGADQMEVCGETVECEVGWIIKAQPGEAKFLYHTGVNGEDHPVWLVNRVQIPQSGSFTHFHWITTASTDPRASDVPGPCDVQNAGQLEMQAEDVVCPGWFMQITAVRSFAFQHGGEIIPVRPGADNASHLNLVTNYAVVPNITPTR